MFDLFGNNNRKSLKQMMDEINEMFGESYPNFRSSSMEHKTETGNEDGMDWEKETFTSPDGRITYIVTSGTFPNIGRKPKTNDNSLESLKQQLDKAVEKEDFQLAIYLRDKIKTFERDQEEIKKVEDELKDCIKSQNFEKAIELRDQLRKMRP
jgi:protein-arginine kinase activator protein McsA